MDWQRVIFYLRASKCEDRPRATAPMMQFCGRGILTAIYQCAAWDSKGQQMGLAEWKQQLCVQGVIQATGDAMEGVLWLSA